MSESRPSNSDDLVARVDFQYQWRTWALFALLFGYGLWSLRDGFIEYPRDNAIWKRSQDRIDRPLKPPHDSSSVLFNQGLGVLLIGLSVPILIWRLRRSRGEYRLADNILRVPGHPPILLAQIRALDLVQWDRKGIAYVEYEPAPGLTRQAALNDMIYQRHATDHIVQSIESYLNALDAPPPSTEQGPQIHGDSADEKTKN